MTAPQPPFRTSSYASQDSTSPTANPQNAALLGAATAFAGRQTPVQKARAPNGAVKAAAVVGSAKSTPRTSPQNAVNRPPAPLLVPVGTSGSVQSGKDNVGGNVPSLNANAMPRLQPPAQAQRGHSKSPSLQAAALAAARAPAPAIATNPAPSTTTRARAKTSHRPAAPPKPRRLSENHTKITERQVHVPTDVTSIPPTTSLVDLFERRASNVPTGQKPTPIIVKPSKDLPIRSPKPVRTSGGISSMFQMELDGAKHLPKPDVDAALAIKPLETPQDDAQESSDSYASASEDLSAPSSPITIRKRDSTSLVPSPRDFANLPKPAKRPAPAPSPLRHLSTEPIYIQNQPPSRSATTPLDAVSSSSMSIKSIPGQYHQLYPVRRLTPSMTGDQLANAMVASSLASSRAPSPRKNLEPSLSPTSRRPKHRSTFTSAFSRTPSPGKSASPAKTGMLHTLRKVETDDEDEPEHGFHPYSKHKKRRLVRKHPNKHHEGDRKRWREAVTERERKRYEGVWAANKGMQYSFTVEEQDLFDQAPQASATLDTKDAVNDQVSNIIVRDVWSRSRLADDALETVWDLVDNESVGRLTKDQFVVGMWLIDQRLKGRKLPVKVSDSVWASVRGLKGIKIRKS